MIAGVSDVALLAISEVLLSSVAVGVQHDKRWIRELMLAHDADSVAEPADPAEVFQGRLAGAFAMARLLLFDLIAIAPVPLARDGALEFFVPFTPGALRCRDRWAIGHALRWRADICGSRMARASSSF
jgi:hypothetical protein